MEFFERFNPNPGLLDSALYYLNQDQEVEQNSKQNRDYIRLYFLKEDFNKVVGYASALKPEAVHDGWAAYRAAESYSRTGQLPSALSWYKRATELMPYSLDFQNKYATCLLTSGNMDEAVKRFEYVLSENPLFINANVNLGYLYMQQGNATMAYSLMQQARLLAPDAEQNLINLAIWYHNNNQDALAKSSLLELLKKHPDNEQAKAMLADLGM